MGTSVGEETERGLRYGILAVFVIGIRQRDPGAVVNAVVALVTTYLPGVVEETYDIEFRPWQRVYVDTAMLLHAVGMLGPYDDRWWWDHLTHTLSSTILGSVTYAIARRRDRNPRPRVVAVVVCVGLLWEFVEYTIHATANRLGFEPILVSYGKTDTLLDLVFNLIGALLVLLLGDRYLRNFTDLDEPDSER
ncbi:hypothetical protein [Salinibaculum salinum]|uniref:hypothetical protein n=1 Tax=Salinibaculum salinum TaxID=3131996 RepID=UPI0030ED6E38